MIGTQMTKLSIGNSICLFLLGERVYRGASSGTNSQTDINSKMPMIMANA